MPHRAPALSLALVWCLAGALGAAEAVGFVERFALAADREATLEELVPGSEVHFYYRALLLQQRRELGAVDALLDGWRERHRRTGERWRRIAFRQILLRYREDPAESLESLRKALHLSFSHQPQRHGDGPDYATALDQDAIAWSAFFARVHRRQPDGLTDHGLWRYTTRREADRHRRETLRRLTWPDHPRLLELVLADLRDRHTPGFGSLSIHGRLTRRQLDALRGRLPSLEADQAFVAAYLRTLRPDAAADLQRDRAAHVAWFDRAWAFVADLPPVHNSLKAHLLFHRLQLDRAMGVFDHARFLAYLRLPRQVGYIESGYLRRAGDDARAQLDRSYETTALPPVGSDEELVRFYLLHYLRDAASPEVYDDLIRDAWLERVFVEAKVTAGIGDPERWFARLDEPGFFRHLRDRVDIDIAPTNPEYLDLDAPVRLAVDVKNVERLLVRIYEIDAGNVYRETGRELGVGLDLDGLVANHRRVIEFDAPPLRRVRREIALDEIAGPGIWIVELIGNGRSSRALIRKGRLFLHQRVTAAGHRCRILDAAGEPRPAATLWLAGHRYRADDAGVITLPFSGEPDRQAVILEEGPLASLDHFLHRAERYRLDAALHLDREQLIAGSEAAVVVRARLRLYGRPVPIAFLEDERLRITAVDRTGTETAIDVDDFELVPGRETVARFRVPEGLRRVDLRLEGRVELASGGDDQDLLVTRSLVVNSVADSVQVAQCHLAPTAGGWVLYRRDRGGDPVAGAAVSLGLRHRDFTSPYTVTLQTDAAGRIELGALADIVEVSASVTGDPTGPRTWSLDPGRAPLPAELHGRVGEPLRVPHPDAAAAPRRDAFALFELRDGAPAADRFDALRLQGGWLELVGLEPGDYRLVLKRRGASIAVRVDRGVLRAGALHAAARRLEPAPGTAVTLRRVALDDEALLIELAGHGALTRVHVFANRYLPAFDHVSGLALPPLAPHRRALHHPGNDQVSGRRIGDEYRYILDRRHAERYPGNMLPRPGLLLNPWARNETETDDPQGGSASGAFGNRSRGGRSKAGGADSGREASLQMPGSQADLDYLAAASPVLLGLRPDADGTLRIARERLGQAQHLQVVAVAPGHSASRRVLLPEAELATRDRRLLDGFDPSSHVSRQQLTSVLAPGDTLELADVVTARLEVYDSLADVFALYRTLAPDAGLEDFAFLTTWRGLDDAAKRERYGEFACHELHLFCYRKDRPFFDAVIAPYLANKKDPTPLDRWLLADELDDLLVPERHRRLNLLERILLGERIAGEREVARRYLRERFALLDRDPGELGRVFGYAVRGRSLGTDDELGFANAKDHLESVRGELRQGNGRLPEKGDDAATGSFDLGPAEPEASADAVVNQMENQMGRRAQVARLEEARRAQRQYYRPLEPTKEWAENNYYHLPYADQDGDLLPVNAFWRDLAEHQGLAGFRSPAFIEAATSRTEILLALALLDLPDEAGEHEVAYVGDGMRLTAASPAIVFHEEFRPVAEARPDDTLLMRQLAFRHGERYRTVDGERVDAEVREEFVVDTPYSLEVVVTNTASRSRDLDLLLQIPEGALPLAGASATDGRPFSIQPFATERFTVSFFFPRPGDFGHFPAHLAEDGAVLAHAAAQTFHAVAEPTRVDTTSWHYVSQNGSLEEVMTYLQEHNIERLDLELLAWRMRERESYHRLVGFLEGQRRYQSTLWSYALHHDDPARIRSYLRRRGDLPQRVGPWIATPIYRSEPVFDGRYRHLEYAPLVNPRAHAFAGERRILNDRYRGQYTALMQQLAHKRALNPEDQLAVVSYLFLQDRIGEALRRFDALERASVSERLQYDYLACYAAFYRRDLERARSIAERHRAHPVPRWNERFARVRAQLDAIAGGDGGVVDPDDPAQQQADLAGSEPSFSLRLDGHELLVDHRNLDACTVNFYRMDVELLFSRDPFVDEDAERFAVIRPNRSRRVELAAGEGVRRIAIPEALRTSNVMIEVVGAGHRRSIASFANALSVQVIDNYGRLRVRHATNRAALPGVYVKVYARLRDDSVVFYKDGYTDLRGAFDYLALSTDELGRVEELAILVLSAEHGAVIDRVQPPKR